MKTLSFGVALGLSLGGCAQLLDIPDDPEVVGRWRCLSEPLPDPTPRATEAVVRVQACDFMQQCAARVENLTARLCLKLDTYCTNPLESDIVDVDGLLTFKVPTPPPGFNGYLEVISSTELCTDPQFGDFGQTMCQMAPNCNPNAPDDNCRVPVYARALLYFNPEVFNDVAEPIRLPLIPAAAIPTMLQAAGAQLDPTKGNLFVTALDCDGRPASGVTYSLAENADSVTQLYVHGGQPNRNELVTDESGVGGFLGVPAGFANITGYNEELQMVGTSAVNAAQFTMTYTSIAPF